jgi:hypothetical protein
MVSFAILIVFVIEGNVRHVQIYLPEQIKQTISFEENGHVRIDGLSGTGETNNPTLVTRLGNYAYVLTVVNHGKLPHMLYIDGLNIQTKLLQPGQNDTITVIPKEPGIYHYYDRASQMQLLGELKVVQVIPEDTFGK